MCGYAFFELKYLLLFQGDSFVIVCSSLAISHILRMRSVLFYGIHKQKVIIDVRPIFWIIKETRGRERGKKNQVNEIYSLDVIEIYLPSVV